MKNNWKRLFEGEFLDIWETPKGSDGKSDIVLAVGGTHLFLKADTTKDPPPKNCRGESKPSKGKSRICKEMVVHQI